MTMSACPVRARSNTASVLVTVASHPVSFSNWGRSALNRTSGVLTTARRIPPHVSASAALDFPAASSLARNAGVEQPRTLAPATEAIMASDICMRSLQFRCIHEPRALTNGGDRTLCIFLEVLQRQSFRDPPNDHLHSGEAVSLGRWIWGVSGKVRRRMRGLRNKLPRHSQGRASRYLLAIATRPTAFVFREQVNEWASPT